jgi:acyl dehydratase
MTAVESPESRVSLVTDEIRGLIGKWGRTDVGCDPVERGAVRRYAQAIMDDDPAYMEEVRPGGPVAPPLFPMNMFRRPFGAPDKLVERADDPDFDGLTADVAQGLPDLPLPAMVMLNGGTRVEFFRYACHGETVSARSRYLDIREKPSKSGPMVVIVIQTEYRGVGDDLLMVVEKTLLRRQA